MNAPRTLIIICGIMISGVERLRKAEHKSNVWNVLCRCLMCCTTQIQLTLLRTVALKGLQVCKLIGVIARILTLCSASRFLLCSQLGNLLINRSESWRWHRRSKVVICHGHGVHGLHVHGRHDGLELHVLGHGHGIVRTTGEAKGLLSCGLLSCGQGRCVRLHRRRLQRRRLLKLRLLRGELLSCGLWIGWLRSSLLGCMLC